ncbi:MAG TPA: DUF3015 domain-containing protein [Syntrophorhabdaceae bacterium]|nr:DUF3015 domain-containing protein [Syntrophorhabdaceae bacterium]
MKKVLFLSFVAFIIVGFSTAALADQKNYGCGLGSMAFEGNDGLISQISAATTNGTFGNQTFGITSGTSNCAQYSTWTSNEKANVFVADNMDSLARDIAKGEGEHLDTLASLLNIAEKDRTSFNAKLQKNFSRIYTSQSVTSTEVIRNIETVISST